MTNLKNSRHITRGWRDRTGHYEHCKGSLKLPVLCLLIVFTAFYGCASTSEMETMKSTIASLRSDSLDRQKEINDLKARLSDVSKDAVTLKEYSFTAMKESQTSLLARTDGLSGELQLLKGRFDESKYFMDKTLKDLASERDMREARLSDLEKNMKDIKLRLDGIGEKKQAAPVPAPAASGDGPTPAPAVGGEDQQRFYDDAQIDLQEKSYADAARKFEDFTKNYPKHQLSPNAFFFIGESFYGEKKYEEAILAYESFMKKFPQHEKVKSSMLKQAYCFLELNDKKTAKVLLENLIGKYPRSDEALEAENKIAELFTVKKDTPVKARKTIKKK